MLERSRAEARGPGRALRRRVDEWTDYVYNHANLKGPVREQWWHEHGCRRWIIVERNTLTHEVIRAEPARR